MIIVDNEIAKRIAENKRIRLAVFGAGFSAKHLVSQIIGSYPGIYLAVIVNRTTEHAESVFHTAGVIAPQTVEDLAQLNQSIDAKQYCITSNPKLIFDSDRIDAVIETTGDVQYGAWVALNTILSKKHTIAINCEMDATIGPLLAYYAEKNHVVYTNTDGDEPGVAMNLARLVSSMGLQVVGAGNLKGYYDPYRTPDTQKEFAAKNNQKPRAVTSFVDGTKLSMESTVLANALGFGVGKRGMNGARCPDVRDCLNHFPPGTFTPTTGVVDFLIGAAPYTGVFVIGYSENALKQEYLEYLKMGTGPYYVFYTPFHLPQLEVPNTVARAVLFQDAAVRPKNKPYCEAITLAKRDLRQGDILDGIGGFDCYALIENFNTSRQQNLLPMGVSEGCRVLRDIPKDMPISYFDIELPKGRLIDQLRNEMISTFFNV